MKKQKVAAIKKANKFNNKQIKELFNEILKRQLNAPWKVRWRLALQILRGK